MAAPELSGWQELGASLERLRSKLREAAPDEATAAETDAYLLRVLAGGLHDTLLGHLAMENGLARALPTRGGPNPDYHIYHAAIDGAGHYRLTGQINSSERIGIGLYSFGAGGESLPAGYRAIEVQDVDAEGRFSLELAADAMGPDVLTIEPGVRVLIVRVLHRQADGTPCTLALRRYNATLQKPLPAGDVEPALAHTARVLTQSAAQFLRWSQLCAAVPNRFILPPDEIATEAQGDPDTTYALGYYDLSDGEWLEAEIPQGLPGYWSLHAYNHWCESLPGAGVHDLNAVTDDDGHVRVHIGPTPPNTVAGTPCNHIDTQGRSRGVLIFRSLGSVPGAIPTASLREATVR